MKLISESTIIANNQRPAKIYTGDDGKQYMVSQLAEMAKVSASTMRQRIKEWGYDSPNLLCKKLKQRKKGGRNLSIKIDIVPGDLEGKYTVRNTKERRALLKKIPSPSEYEKALWG
jgi:hypothetical protein